MMERVAWGVAGANPLVTICRFFCAVTDFEALFCPPQRIPISRCCITGLRCSERYS